MKTKIVKRPWGKFEEFCENEKATVKLLEIKPKEMLSLQSHIKRKEFWKIIEGSGKVVIGNKVFPAKKNSSFTIPKKRKHRFMAGKNGVKILEISLGEFDENDEIRYEDSYGRK